MRFLPTHPRGPGSAYELLAIEGELRRRGFAAANRGGARGHMRELAARVAGRLGMNSLVHPLPGGPVLLVHGGVPDGITFPSGLWTRFIPYSFDCWPREWPRWESFYRRNRTELAILTARQCAEHFQSRLQGCRFLWLPECIDAGLYNPGGMLVNRDIDVLELGRRFDEFHTALRPVLEQQRAVHMYERIKGEVIFERREALVSAHANTKVSVCFPSSLTHPERSGNIETLTLRYLESMASRTLVVGKCPRELADLFGYNPVVELSDPRQVLDVLSAIAAYQPLVDRNYHRLLEVATTAIRVEQLIAALRANGYSAP